MAISRELSSDALALIHHVQLNETGWLEKATVEAVKFLLWLSSSSVTPKQIVASQKQANISHLTEHMTTNILNKLVNEGICNEDKIGYFILCELPLDF